MGLEDTLGGVFKKGGNILGDLFGYDISLTSYLNYIFSSDCGGSVLKFFYEQLYRDFSPDINGYTLIFFIPPDLSGYKKLITDVGLDGGPIYNQTDKESYMNVVGKIMTFAAIDFTPPQIQVRSESVSLRSGSIPIASEVSETDTCSITFIDNRQLDIYMFHHIWIEYIREILEGTIEPDPIYYSEELRDEPNNSWGCIDYAASFYIVKYRPDMKTVTFVSKCVGVFPQNLPNKEQIGTRTANESVILPFTYSCSGYREALYTEQNFNWIFDELNEIIWSFVFSESSSMLFSGFLGNILNSVIGSPLGALKNLTGNAAKLGEIGLGALSGLKDLWGSIQGIAQPNGLNKIFRILPPPII